MSEPKQVTDPELDVFEGADVLIEKDLYLGLDDEQIKAFAYRSFKFFIRNAKVGHVVLTDL